MMFSATLSEDLKKVCRKFMQKVINILLYKNNKFIIFIKKNKNNYQVNGSIYR